MPIDVRCPDCRKSYRLIEHAAGKSFRCKSCSAIFKVPVRTLDPFNEVDDYDDETEELDRPSRPAPPPHRRARAPAAPTLGERFAALRWARLPILAVAGLLVSLVLALFHSAFLYLAFYPLCLLVPIVLFLHAMAMASVHVDWDEVSPSMKAYWFGRLFGLGLAIYLLLRMIANPVRHYRSWTNLAVLGCVILLIEVAIPSIRAMHNLR